MRLCVGWKAGSDHEAGACFLICFGVREWEFEAMSLTFGVVEATSAVCHF